MFLLHYISLSGLSLGSGGAASAYIRAGVFFSLSVSFFLYWIMLTQRARVKFPRRVAAAGMNTP